MRRAGAIALLVTAAVGLLALLVEAAGDRRDLAFTIGVVPSMVAADVQPGATVCQAPIYVPDEFSGVRLRAAGSQPLEVTVLGIPSGRELGSARLPGGYADGIDRTAAVGEIDADQKIGVCVRNAGRRRAELIGNVGAAAPLSGAAIGRRQLGSDLTLVFVDERSSMLAQLPRAFDRAAAFRPGFVGPWLYWLLGAAALIGVPLLLARALADSDATRAP
jgi:hypothetical protein